VLYQDGRFSTISNFKIVTYEEGTGRLAGIPICEKFNTEWKTPFETIAHSSESPFSPFRSELDYGLAAYFHRRQLTKGDVDDFLYDKSLESIVSQLSYKNANQWQEKLLESKYEWTAIGQSVFSGVCNYRERHPRNYPHVSIGFITKIWRT